MNKIDSVDINWDSNDLDDLDLNHGNSFHTSEYTPTNTTLDNKHKDIPLFVGKYITYILLIYHIILKVHSNCFATICIHQMFWLL